MGHEDELPGEIKRFDVIRVEYGKRKLCECREPHYEVDFQNRLVSCLDCGAIVDAFDALVKITRHYDRLADYDQYLLETRRKLVNYKPRLAIIKELEHRYRSKTYPEFPVCPRCGEAFDFSEITQWRGSIFPSPPQEVSRIEQPED